MLSFVLVFITANVTDTFKFRIQLLAKFIFPEFRRFVVLLHLEKCENLCSMYKPVKQIESMRRSFLND